jgi:hypothetical protein
MDQRRFEMCEAYHTAMMTPLSETANWETINRGCFYAAKTIGFHVKRLQSAGLMPHDLAFSNHSMCELFDKAKQMAEPQMPNSCTTYRCSCRNEELRVPNLVKRLQKTAAALRGLKESFICLNCIKSGGEKGEGACKGHDMDVSLARHPTVVSWNT